MAVGQCNIKFDWCDQLIRVKRNYSNDECCNIVKNKLREFKGADSGFIKDVCSRANSTFRVARLFYPVYNVKATVTYDWNESNTHNSGDYSVTTTTHNTKTNTFTKNFFKGIYQGCCPDVFVGRNDERFYTLSHVDDLDGGVYNASCVYLEQGLQQDINAYAAAIKPESNAEHLLLVCYGVFCSDCSCLLYV